MGVGRTKAYSSGLSLVELLVVMALVSLAAMALLGRKPPAAHARLLATAGQVEALLREGARLAQGGSPTEVRKVGEEVVLFLGGNQEVRRVKPPLGVSVVGGSSSEVLAQYAAGGALASGSGSRVGVCASRGGCVWLYLGDGGAVWRKVERGQ